MHQPLHHTSFFFTAFLLLVALLCHSLLSRALFHKQNHIKFCSLFQFVNLSSSDGESECVLRWQALVPFTYAEYFIFVNVKLYLQSVRLVQS